MRAENREWLFSTEHGQICKVIEIESLWGQKIFRVWLPEQEAIVRIPWEKLKPLDDPYVKIDQHKIAYIAAASRVADALTQDVLLAPIESYVIPLPHQIWTLYQAISNDWIRYLLADEVGLEKILENEIKNG